MKRNVQITDHRPNYSNFQPQKSALKSHFKAALGKLIKPQCENCSWKLQPLRGLVKVNKKKDYRLVFKQL